MTQVPEGLLQLRRLFGESNVVCENGKYVISMSLNSDEYPHTDRAFSNLIQHLQMPSPKRGYDEGPNMFTIHFTAKLIEMPQNIEKLKQFSPNDFRNLTSETDLPEHSSATGGSDAPSHYTTSNDVVLFRLNQLAPGTDWVITHDQHLGPVFRTRFPVTNPRRAIELINLAADLTLILPPEGQGYVTIPVDSLTEECAGKRLRNLKLGELLQRVVGGGISRQA